ncbi:MAG: M23 family metallopeptidase [Desulfobulbaceae bacterium]|nr:M23 family metallopeptidase [Desulfobulbaceae bacterium]
MSKDTLHIIITGESDRSLSLAIPKKIIRNFSIGITIFLLFLIFGTIQGGRYYNLRLNHDKVTGQFAQTRQTLQETNLAKSNMKKQYEQKISSMIKEKEELLASSISELDERSKIIQTVMDHIGVDIRVEEDQKHSGGPYIEANDEKYMQDLIYKTDRYLDVFNKIPLGKPVPGSISSRYGYRSDPLIHKRAFHSGVDFRGKTGEEIKVTANGIVKRATYNKGLGNYLLISHGNGYETLYGHMKKLLVKKGETIKRGQPIGLIGSTGRSTGSHLHYEIHFNKKTVNPKRYLQIAKMSISATDS